MQISQNTTGMVASSFITADKSARDYCVVVIKGTFRSDAHGELTLIAEQAPLVATDEHYGDPAITCIRYGCDFVLEKPMVDVLVVGKAIAPGGKAVRELPVRLEIAGRAKDIVVRGERRWAKTLFGLVMSDPPAPFLEMPLTFDRAFGGQDDSRGPGRAVIERRNPSGVGFHPYRPHEQIAGTVLPNLEHPRHPIRSPRDHPEPIGFGFLAAACEARARHAGTYDERWRDEAAPYPPADFDCRYFQSAPEDQRVPFFRGGELIRCIHMSKIPVVQYRMPAIDIPVRFRFQDHEETKRAVLDTVTLEPHEGIAKLVWRAKAPLGKKLNMLKEILVGDLRLIDEPVAYREGKPVFGTLGAAIGWLRERRQQGIAKR